MEAIYIATSEARLKANAKYNAKAYDQIALRAEKALHLPERIKAGATKAGKSTRGYLIEAITEKLDADGIPPATDTEQTE